MSRWRWGSSSKMDHVPLTHHVPLRQMIHTKKYVKWNRGICEGTHKEKRKKQRLPRPTLWTLLLIPGLGVTWMRLGSKWALAWNTFRGERGWCQLGNSVFFTIFIFFLFLKNGNPVTENVGKGRGGKWSTQKDRWKKGEERTHSEGQMDGEATN